MVLGKIQGLVDRHVKEIQMACDLSGSLSTIQDGFDYLKGKVTAKTRDIQGDGSVIREQIYI